MYIGVPTGVLHRASSGSASSTRDTPKSPIFTTPALVKNTFADCTVQYE